MSKYITVLSDTHGNLYDLDFMRGDFLSSDYIFFLGDGRYGSKKCQLSITDVYNDRFSNVPSKVVFVKGK
jgi:predicted phosphodiesterase